MKTTFEHLGLIKHATLDLNDLTIIAGANNTGKTYITYTLYGFLKLWNDFVERFVKSPETQNIVKELIEKGMVKVPNTLLLQSFDETINTIAGAYSLGIPDIFSTKEGQFDQACIQVTTEKPVTESLNTTILYKIGDAHEVNAFLKDNFLYISLIGKDKKVASFIVEDIVNKIIGNFFYQGCFPHPFLATAERLGISLFYKELDETKNAIVEELQKWGQRDGGKKAFDPIAFMDRVSSRYAAPIKDNITFTRAAVDFGKKNKFVNSVLLVNRLKEIIGGDFKNVDNEIRFFSTSKKNGKFDIPLHLASSSVRGLCDVYFFLKYIARPGMILMIDEPESYLSPANQIALARLLALCVNNGLKVFITTHSDYIIKEFNNLIMLGRDFIGKDDFLKEQAHTYSEHDFLKPESVNAYVCQGGTLEKCPVDTKGMDILFFDDTIDSINRISDQLDFLTGNGV